MWARQSVSPCLIECYSFASEMSTWIFYSACCFIQSANVHCSQHRKGQSQQSRFLQNHFCSSSSLIERMRSPLVVSLLCRACTTSTVSYNSFSFIPFQIPFFFFYFPVFCLPGSAFLRVSTTAQIYIVLIIIVPDVVIEVWVIVEFSNAF